MQVLLSKISTIYAYFLFQYGVVAGGSTMNFFKESKMPTYQKMWEFMSGPMKEEVMVSGNGEGIEKVVNDDGGYAFMMESSSIQVLHIT